MQLKFSWRCKGSLFSRQLTIGLIILIILADVMDLSPHGILAQRRPRPCRHRHDHYHNRCHYQQHRQRGYHRHHNNNHQHHYRRRNDSSAEIIQAEVFSVDEMSGSSSSGVVSGNISVYDGSSGVGVVDMSMPRSNSSNATAAAVEEGTAETIGFIRGFLPGLNLGGGGGNKGKGGGGGGFFRNAFGGGGKGRGLFGGGGHGGDDSNNNNNNNGGKVIFPESPKPLLPPPTSGGNSENTGQGGYTSGGGYGSGQTSGMMMGWGSGDGQRGKEASGGGLFGGGGLFRNPFGGGGSGKGRGPFRLLSKLNSDQPCAAGLASLPILSRIPFLPKTRFPSFIPSGVNTCDATCGGSGGGEWRRVPPTDKEKEEMEKNGGNTCTYNWRDSLTGFPFLLFRCQCKVKCPPKKVRLSGGLLNARCENVSEKKSRCKCPYGQQSFKCSLSFLPVAVPLVQRTKPYYCTCCNDESTPLGEPLGGYGYGPPAVSSTEMTAQSQQVVGGYEGAASSGGGGYQGAASTGQGGYEGAASSTGQGGYEGAASSTGQGGYEGAASTTGQGGYSIGTSASEHSQTTKELAQGKPLGIDSLYEHLRRWR